MLRIILFVVLGVLALLVGGVALFPMSMAADLASKQIPDFKFSAASGSVWDGSLTGVSYGAQKIGDLKVKTDLMALFTGRAAGTLGLAREGFTGESGISYGIGDQGLDLNNLKIAGDVGMVPGLPVLVAQGGGKFTLTMNDVKFAKSLCEKASGEVWTDALTKVNFKGWVGPELRGPVTCASGKLNVQAAGKAATGEDVQAAMSIDQRLGMELTATVANATPGAVQALGQLGFVAEGDKLVLHRAMGGQ